MSHPLHFHVWFASISRMAHFEKTIEFNAIPRVGESVQFSAPAICGEDTWSISSVVHRESGPIEIWTSMLNSKPDHMYSFAFEEQFDDYVEAFSTAGWICHLGVKKNVFS